MGETIRFRRAGILFEWDAAKSNSTLLRRGFDFAYATSVFFDELAVGGYNRSDPSGEDRFFVIGQSEDDAALFIVFCERLNHGEQSTRIISAQRANRQERRIYAQNKES